MSECDHEASVTGKAWHTRGYFIMDGKGGGRKKETFPILLLDKVLDIVMYFVAILMESGEWQVKK